MTFGNGIEDVGRQGVSPDDCTDRAGNAADPTGPWQVRVDTRVPRCDVSPARVVISPTGAMTTLTFTLTATDNLMTAYVQAHAAIASITGDNGTVAADIGAYSVTPEGAVTVQIKAIVGSPGRTRTYTIRFLVTDEAGNTDDCTARVVVM